MEKLEQWQIDLRNQLLEYSESPEFSEENILHDTKKMTNSKKNSLIGYYFIIFILMAIIVFLYDQKSDGVIINWIFNRIHFIENENKYQNKENFPENFPINNNYSENEQLKIDVSKMKKDMEIINDKLKWNSERITLMGMLINENFVIISNNYDRSDLIFFNSDWTINKMPRYLKIQESDKDYLKKFVKPSSN